MLALILSVLLCVRPGEPMPVKFEVLTLKETEQFNGMRVSTTFTVGTIPFTWGEGKNLITVAAPRYTGIDRTVILKSNRLMDADRSVKVTIVGTLRVIHHPAADWRDELPCLE